MQQPVQLTLPQAVQLALQHQQAGRAAEAKALYQQVLAIRPDLPLVVAQLGAIHKAAGQFEEALDYFRRAVLLEPGNFAHHYQLGETLQSALMFYNENPMVRRQGLRNYQEADGWLRCAIRLDPGFVLGHFRLGHGLNALGRYEEAVRAYEECLRRAPGHYHAYKDLIACLKHLGRHAEAEAHFRQAAALYPDNVRELETIEVISYDNRLGNLCELGSISPLEGTWHIEGNVKFFPKDFDNRKSLGDIIASYLMCDMRPLPAPLFTMDSKILTFGSCFAIELRKVLRRYSSAARDVSIPEGLNNTFAMRNFMEWALTGDTSSTAYWYDTAAGSNRIVHLDPHEEQQHFETALKQADGFIFTLGLSEVWRDKTNGQVFWRGVPQAIFEEGRYELVLSTVEDNVANIQRIYDLVQEHCGPKPVIFTVSPIPLNATFREVPCVIADCASKSILRAALEYLFMPGTDNPNAYYFPSFEVIRWLGAHMTRATFGDPVRDCQFDSRHVPSEIVEEIIKAFIRFHFVPGHGLA